MAGVGLRSAVIQNLKRANYAGTPIRSLIQGDAGCVMPVLLLGSKQKEGECKFEIYSFRRFSSSLPMRRR